MTCMFVGSIPSANATTRTSAGGVAVSFDTTTASGYSASVSGGMQVTGTGGGHSLSVAGIHLVSSLWDYTVSSASENSMLVSNPGSNRVIQSGTLVVQNNTSRYTGTAVFSNVGFNSTSCFPQSGTITTTISGTATGTETLTFNGSDTATLVAIDGTSSTFTLDHCF